MKWIREDADGVTLILVIQPRAGKTAVVGEHGDALKVRVAAPPVDGAANAMLTEFLAKTLGVAKAAITIRSGETGRRKVLRIEGVTAEQVRSELAQSLGGRR